MSITIRPVKTIADCRILEDLMMKIWGWGARNALPSHITITIAKNGGVLLLARDDQANDALPSEEPIGFCLGFVGFTKELRVKHCSHQAGVLPAYQNSGVGYQLKLAQRQAVLAQHLDQVTWTFDLLETRNANLNLHKLGAVCCTYLRNVYGELVDSLNKGLPTDRLQVDWWIASPWVASRVEKKASLLTLQEWLEQGTPILNPAKRNHQGYLVPSDMLLSPQSQYCLVEIPANIQAIKAKDIRLAYAWRMQSRAVFEDAFSQGYHVIDMLYQAGRSCYLLQKDWQGQSSRSL